MIFGYVRVEGGVVHTHRDSYDLASLKVSSTRRPFLGMTGALGGAFLGFMVAFSDLLYPMEMLIITCTFLAAIAVSSQMSQLKFLSRELQGSELSGVIWGRYSSLNRLRIEIMRKRAALLSGEAS